MLETSPFHTVYRGSPGVCQNFFNFLSTETELAELAIVLRRMGGCYMSILDSAKKPCYFR